MNEKEIFERLTAPFALSDIKWRIQIAGLSANRSPWAMVTAYVGANEIRDRLDSVLGATNWTASYEEIGGGKGTLCKLSLRIGNEWITKSDGASSESEIEAVKSGLTGAFRRVAGVFGIGRYLSRLDTMYAEISENGIYRGSAQEKQSKIWVPFKWTPPKLPSWALPSSESIPSPAPKVEAAKPGASVSTRPSSNSDRKPAPPIRTPSPAPMAPSATATPADASLRKGEPTLDDIPKSLFLIFQEMDISSTKIMELCRRKNWDFVEVERILRDLRPAAVA